MNDEKGLMINPSVKDLTQKMDSSFAVVMAAAKRARQLTDGSKPVVDSAAIKAVSIAADEIKEGKVCIKSKEVQTCTQI